MENIPNKIYLQIDTDGEEIKDFNELHEVSWCSDKINKTDLEYIHISELKSVLQSLTDEIKEKAKVEYTVLVGAKIDKQSIQTITDEFIKNLK